MTSLLRNQNPKKSLQTLSDHVDLVFDLSIWIVFVDPCRDRPFCRALTDPKVLLFHAQHRVYRHRQIRNHRDVWGLNFSFLENGDR